MGFDKLRAIIDKIILCGRALFRVRAKIKKKNTLFGRALVRVRAKN